MDFPQYRRYANHRSYFKILNESEYIERRKEPKGIQQYQFKATTLPDRNLLQDMLYEPQPYWEIIDEHEWLGFCKKK
jgi:hypothetical protein